MNCGCIGACRCFCPAIGPPGLYLSSGRIVPPELYESSEQVVYPLTGIPTPPPIIQALQLAVPTTRNFAQTFAVHVHHTTVNSISSVPGKVNLVNTGGLAIGLNIVNVRAECPPCGVRIQVLARGTTTAGNAPVGSAQRRTYSTHWPLVGYGRLTVNVASIDFGGDEWTADTEYTIYIRYHF
jgi:hypothetical protein